MTPYFDQQGIRLYCGHALRVLKSLPAGIVRTCVTSPPYWGLRDYGAAEQIGLEPTPELYVANLVTVFDEVRRVLADDGTLWLNLGDSYSNDTKWGGASGGKNRHSASGGYQGQRSRRGKDCCPKRGVAAIGQPKHHGYSGLKPKDLVGIPWMVAFALRAAGWYLRQDIIWAKPNPMPESVTDRCTKSHEYIFLLSKSERYYYDNEAIAEPATDSTIDRISQSGLDEQAGSDRVPGKSNGPMKAVVKGRGGKTAFRGQGHFEGGMNVANRDGRDMRDVGVKRSGNKERKPASARGVPVDTNGKSSGAVAGSVPWEGSTRNKRSVWTVTTKPFKGAHFATFPMDLIEPCILAGSEPGDIVLDPFNGSGTTGGAAQKHGRRYIWIDLNPDYLELSKKRFVQRVLFAPGVPA